MLSKQELFCVMDKVPSPSLYQGWAVVTQLLFMFLKDGQAADCMWYAWART